MFRDSLDFGFLLEIVVNSLKSRVSRSTFLSDASHRIRFVYTPKHCSWLNQIEIWFSILVRRLLGLGSLHRKQRYERDSFGSLTTSTRRWPSRFDGLMPVVRFRHSRGQEFLLTSTSTTNMYFISYEANGEAQRGGSSASATALCSARPRPPGTHLAPPDSYAPRSGASPRKPSVKPVIGFPESMASAPGVSQNLRLPTSCNCCWGLRPRNRLFAFSYW